MIYRFGDFELDTELFELRRRRQPLAAERRILDLLIELIESRARVVSREELLETLWPNVAVREQVLSQAVYEARKLLGDDARRPACIQTVRGRGFRFIADVEEGGGLARPVAGKPPGFTPFVGRLEMLAALDEALEGACAGRGGLVVVSGEPGIGKSRLAEEFASRAGRRGVRVLLGRCPEDEGTPSFWPWAQLLRSCAAGIRPADLSLLTRDLPQLSLIVPELVADAVGAGLEGLDPQAARFRVFDGVTQFFTRAAAEEPLALVLDDLHRADHPSILLLRFLARYVAGIPLLVMGTYREAELHANSARAEVIAEVARETTVRPLRLEGFSREEIARFFIAHLGADPSPEVIVELHERTGGNPFFLTHLAPRIQETLESAGDDARRLPRTIREAIAQQLAGLAAECKELLEVAAVIGRDFRLQLLQAALGRSPSEIGALLGQARDAGVVQLSASALDEYRFAHVLLRDVLYEALEPARRIQLHAAILGGLEANEGPEPEVQLAELAHHSGAAASRVGREVAIDYATRAGLAARQRLAFEEAADHFERALTLIESGPADESTLCDLLLLLGEAQTRAGARETGRAVLQRAATLAQRIGAPERLAEVALSVTPGFFSIEVGLHDPSCVELLRGAIAALPAGMDGLRARLSARLAMALYWLPDSAAERAALVSEAGQLATRAEDLDAMALAACARCASLWSPDNLQPRIEDANAAIGTADRAGDVEHSLMGRVFRISSRLEAGQLLEVEREVSEFETLLRARPVPQAMWYVPLFRSMLAHSRGRLGEAENRAHEFLAMGTRAGDTNVRNSFAAVISALCWHRGTSSVVLESAAELIEKFPSIIVWRCGYAVLALDAGQVGAARASYETVLGQLDRLPRDMMWLTTLVQLADLSVEFSDRRGAEAVCSMLRPHAGKLAVVGYGVLLWGSVARALGRAEGLLGHWADSYRLFEGALETEQRSGMSVWAAYTKCHYAEAILRHGRMREVRRALFLAEAAKVTAGELGLVGLEERVARVIAAATPLV